jgi:hypothetical protein
MKAFRVYKCRWCEELISWPSEYESVNDDLIKKAPKQMQHNCKGDPNDSRRIGMCDLVGFQERRLVGSRERRFNEH